MWLHQRTGQNTAVTVGLGSIGLGLLIVGAVATNIPVWGAVMFALVVGSLWWGAYRSHRESHDESPRDGCRWCRQELASLRAQEQRDNSAADLQRLRGKYRP